MANREIRNEAGLIVKARDGFNEIDVDAMRERVEEKSLLSKSQ